MRKPTRDARLIDTITRYAASWYADGAEDFAAGMLHALVLSLTHHDGEQLEGSRAMAGAAVAIGFGRLARR